MNSISFTSQHRKLAEGMGADAEFWRIAIDGTELTTAARPFNASDSEIVLHECEECYCCGQPEVLVRKYDAQTVIWFAKTTEHDNNPAGCVSCGRTPSPWNKGAGLHDFANK